MRATGAPPVQFIAYWRDCRIAYIAPLFADALKRALHTYTASGGEGEATVDQEQVVAVMEEKYEVVRDLLHGFDYRAILAAEPQSH